MIPKQFRIHAVLILACLFIIFFPILSEKPDAQKTAEATAEALAFLQLVDAGKYAESWQSAASLMRERVPQAEWIATLSKAQALSGPLVERVKKNASYSKTAQDSPEGEYILLTFEAKFQRAEEVAEYVTVMREGERWRVAGYFLK